MSDNFIKDLNVLHLLYSSLPKLSGYAIRSHYMLKFQNNYVNSYALTDPRTFRKKKFDVVDGIHYYRYPPNFVLDLAYDFRIFKYLRFNKIFDWFYRSQLKIPLKFLRKVVSNLNINVVHAHTPENFAKFGKIIADEKKIPFVYEVRGFWEDSQVGLRYFNQDSYKYYRYKKRETSLMRKADKIVTLGETMKDEIIKRGIPKSKIIIVPNCVDTTVFKPKPQNLALKQKLDINNKKIIGYVGSIRRIEGIEYLLRALNILNNHFKDLVLLLIGPYDIYYYNELNYLIRKLGIRNNVKFIGPIPNTEISEYYSILDLNVIPRKNLRVNRLVTPLKPLEIMAMEKVVITSNLPALREFVKPNISGDLFEAENPKDLAEKITIYLTDSKALNQLGTSAREFVESNFDWHINVKKYIHLYKNLLK